MPIHKSPPPDRRLRLLAFANDLLDDLEELDLDTIDGEFYWRWCRADLLEPLSTFWPRLPRPVGVPSPRRDGSSLSDAPVISGIFEPEGVFDYLREGLRFVQEVLAFSDRLAQRYPRVIWQRLLDGERVAMRAADADVRVDDDDEPRHVLTLKVYSGAWTGKQVEDELHRLASALRRVDTETSSSSTDAIDVQLRFAFTEAPRDQWNAVGEGAVRSPCVLVETPLPLPPKGTIAREYETLVRQQYAWHLELPGSGSRQDKEVALRTWTIALLVHDGVTVNGAIDAIHLKLGLDDITPSCFGSDRKKLLERVPEAEPYLYAATSPGIDDTRLIRHEALVSNGAAQPSPHEQGLFP